MKHRVAGRKLGRDSAQRSALMKGLVTELFRHDRISTTAAKARFMRGDAEHLITIAKRGLAEGGNNVHAHRLAAKVIPDPDVTTRLFNEIAPRFAERPGRLHPHDQDRPARRRRRRDGRPRAWSSVARQGRQQGSRQDRRAANPSAPACARPPNRIRRGRDEE